MQALHEQELAEARKRIAAQGFEPSDFTLDLQFMEPDPDGAGMFTVRHEITATAARTGKAAGYIGGIGTHWLDAFEQDLKDGAFA